MAVPKKKTSKRRSGNRSAANMGIKPIAMTKCQKCGEPKRTHVVCAFCGYYGDKKVLDVKTKLDKKLKKEEKQKESSEQA
jgi:large subunit ribosomal protein L32